MEQELISTLMHNFHPYFSWFDHLNVFIIQSKCNRARTNYNPYLPRRFHRHLYQLILCVLRRLCGERSDEKQGNEIENKVMT